MAEMFADRWKVLSARRDGICAAARPAADYQPALAADWPYRSAKNEEHLARNGLRSQIHRKKPKGKPMPEAIAIANGRKSRVRAGVEHVVARQKGPMALVIRSIGLARAAMKIGLANLTYNVKRVLWRTTRPATA